jgi:hypothetical protein
VHCGRAVGEHQEEAPAGGGGVLETERLSGLGPHSLHLASNRCWDGESLDGGTSPVQVLFCNELDGLGSAQLSKALYRGPCGFDQLLDSSLRRLCGDDGLLPIPEAGAPLNAL